MNCRLRTLLLALLLATSVHAEVPGEVQVLTKLDERDVDITIDGVLNEAVWDSLPAFDGMVVIEPDTLAETPFATHRRMFYTDSGLYIGVRAEQPVDSLVQRLSSRDQFISRDDVSFTIDPSGQGLYGYWFGVNLGDTLQDGTVLPERQFSNQWDGPWRGASAQHDEGWSAEMFLPWSMMTMPERRGDKRIMGYYLSREVASQRERWAYPALPSTKPVFLSQLQKIEVEGINPRQQFTFYPFAAATWDNADVGREDSYKTGFDVFWRPSTNLQLTATVNPDFGNVESDNVVVNLSSFENFFPERRAFFLEGNEIFIATPRARQSRGDPTTLVNTRRIGSSPIRPSIPGLELPSIEANQPSELLGAAKVTGQSGRIRYGLLAAFEDETQLNGTVGSESVSVLQDGRDFAIARALYEDTRGGGRRALGWMSTLVTHPQEEAHTHGLDFHYLTRSGDWSADGQVMASQVDGTDGYGGFIDLKYVPKRGVRHEFSFDYFDDRLDISDFGFLQRNDIWGPRYEFSTTRSELASFKELRRELSFIAQFNGESRLVRSGVFFNQDMLLNNNHFASVRLDYFPGRWDDINSEGNGSFRIQGRWNGGFFYETDQSKRLQFGVGSSFREEDIDGLILDQEISATWRPTDRFSLVFRLNYEQRDGWLIHAGGRDFSTYDSEFWRPRIETDFFLSARQQFRMTLQWAGIKAYENARWQVPAGDGDLINETMSPSGSRNFSISRLTFQARYRWEIAPLSDLFVVYTRGSNLATVPENSFERSFRDALRNPIVDVFVIKLRYRLGN